MAIYFFHLLNFFILALLCHGQLVAKRPPVNQLTVFYFCLALGGVLAGIFNSFVALRVFNGAYEYPLVLALAMFCIPVTRSKNTRLMPFIVLAILLINYLLPNTGWLLEFKRYHIAELAALCVIVIWPGNKLSLFAGVSILFIFLFFPGLQQNKILAQQRNFYGIKQVLAMVGSHVLISQNTVHGFQLQQPDNQTNGALGYYGPPSKVVQLLQQKKKPLRAIILGLGTGMMACQYRKEDSVKMVDIDSQVIDIATNTELFTYLKDCPPQTTVLQGDGRSVMQKTKNAEADLLVIDAFSSDAIPIHLLTLEAFKLYLQKITPNDGVILVHVSNRHLRLLPVLTAVGRQLDLIVLQKLQEENTKMGQFASEWVLLTSNQEFSVSLMRSAGWRFVIENNNRLWTDDYSNLVPLLKW